MVKSLPRRRKHPPQPRKPKRLPKARIAQDPKAALRIDDFADQVAEAYEARKSLAITGAPESFGTPLISAAFPETVMSAPIRRNSLT